MNEVDRIYQRVQRRIANPEGISVVVHPDRLAAAATEALAIPRRLGRVLHAEVRPDGWIEVVFRDEGPR